MPHLIVAVFIELLDIAKVDLHLDRNRRRARRAQNQIDEQARRLVLLRHQVVLKSAVAFTHVEGRHDGICCVRKRVAVWRLDFGSQRVSDLRCNWPLACVVFGSILVKLDQGSLKPLHRRNADRERFGVVRRFRVPLFEVGTGEELRQRRSKISRRRSRATQQESSVDGPIKFLVHVSFRIVVLQCQCFFRHGRVRH